MNKKQKSAPQRLLWAQFDALQMGSGWDEEDIQKPLETVIPAVFIWQGLWNRPNTESLKKVDFPLSTTPRISVTAVPRDMTV